MNKQKKTFTFISKFKGILIPMIAIALTLTFTTIAGAHGGDTSLIHACIGNVNGRLTFVGVNDTCGTNETAMDWLKNVFAGSGLTIDRGDNGATLSADLTYVQKRVSSTCATGSAIKSIGSDGTVTCESVSSSVSRYEVAGSSLTSPNSTWQDAPNATITQTFNAGTIKVTYTGSIVMQNGDGTAYVRLKVQPTGGTASYVGDITVYRSSSPSQSEVSNIPFTVQKVISVSSGEYSITPQVNINNSNWSLFYQNDLVVEQ